MPNHAKPLRSLLFVPGNKEDWMRKAPRYGADALIFDLEDSVPAAHRPQARKMVRRVIEELGDQGQTIFVRVSSLDTGETGEDLEAVVCKQLYGIFLPKVFGPKDVVAADALLSFFEKRQGVPVGHTLINPLLETAEAHWQAHEIAKASPRVAHMGGGTAKDADAARALGYEWTPEGMETYPLRAMMLMAVRAAGVPYPVSGLWVDIHDNEGLRAYAVQTRRLGYQGLQAIYPGQIPIINEVFSPRPEDIAHWKKVLDVMAKAEADGTTAVALDGKMIDTAHVKHARVHLAYARKLGLVRD